MINLLPPKEKEAIVFARLNVRLRHWIIGALVGLVGVALVVSAGNMLVGQTISDYDSTIATTKKRLENNKQQETLQEVKGIQESFKLVIDVLSREVLFSKILPRVGQVMPSGTVLEGLSLNTDSTETAFDITASAVDFTSGSQIQINLTDPANKLFSKADLVNVACKESEAESEKPAEYPCKVTMRVQPTESSQFLLISPSGKKS